MLKVNTIEFMFFIQLCSFYVILDVYLPLEQGLRIDDCVYFFSKNEKLNVAQVT